MEGEDQYHGSRVHLKTGTGNEEKEIRNEKLHFYWRGLACAVGAKAHPMISLPSRLSKISLRDGGRRGD